MLARPFTAYIPSGRSRPPRWQEVGAQELSKRLVASTVSFFIRGRRGRLGGVAVVLLCKRWCVSGDHQIALMG